MNQLEKKLQKQTRKSHQKWMLDICDLYQEAGLWPLHAYEAMSLVLMEALAAVWATSKDGVDEKRLLSLLERMTEARKKLIRKLQQEYVNGH